MELEVGFARSVQRYVSDHPASRRVRVTAAVAALP
jgi:hypothetical protein